MKKNYFFALFGALTITTTAVAQLVDTLTFENHPLDPMTGYFNGSTLPPNSTSFSVGNYTLDNSYNAEWGSWSGFAVSKIQDSVTPGYTNQYAAYPLSGANNSEKYGVFYSSGKIEFDVERTLKSINIANTTYAVQSMRNGDGFAKKFGSPNGPDNTTPDGTEGKDWFLLEIIPLDNADALVGDTIKFYLADYRFDDDTKDYILEKWEKVNLGNITAKKLTFKLSSSDVGEFGMNTPGYLAFDNLVTTTGCTPNNVEIDSTITQVNLPIVWNGITITEAGTYKYADEHIDSCSITTLKLTVTPKVEVGLSEVDNMIVEVYPNPASDVLTVTVTVTVEKPTQLQLVNAVGQTVLVQTINGTTNLNVSTLPKGVYFLSVNAQHKAITQKVILQ